MLVLGSGCREHALVWRLLQSPQTTVVYCAPGNGGTSAIAVNVPLEVDDAEGIALWCLQNGVDLVIPGPERALAAGVADVLQGTPTLCWGPGAEAAQIETSKSFAKTLMAEAGIPTPGFHTFEVAAEALRFVEDSGQPWVVKADGLAQGKGVVVAATVEETREAVKRALELHIFGEAGARVLLEEVAEGPEVSVMAACDGEHLQLLAAARDYKRAADGDAGPNTGGMGAYSPPRLATPELLEQVRSSILEPALRAMAARGLPYRGVLYAGVMLTERGPVCLEFTARLGDPEAEVVLPRLESDLVDLALACCRGTLDQLVLTWKPEACVGLVLVSHGYPERYSTGFPIEGLHRLPQGVMAFHGGTAVRPVGITRNSRLVTDGGRVLTLVALGRDHAEARQRAYAAAEVVTFDGKTFRSDIALREVEAA